MFRLQLLPDDGFYLSPIMKQTHSKLLSKLLLWITVRYVQFSNITKRCQTLKLFCGSLIITPSM